MARRTRRPLPIRLPRIVGLGRSGVGVVTIALVVVSIWLLAGFVNQVIISAQMDRRKAELAAEIAQLEADNERLKAGVDYAESPSYAERLAREQLGMAREGDTVILPVLPAATDVPVTPTPQVLPTPTPEPNWRGWARAFFPGDQ